MQRSSALAVKVVVCIGAGLVAGAVLALTVRYSSHQEWRRGQSASQDSNLAQAIVHYERAIKWYTPFSQSVEQSINRLWSIGLEAESQADVTLALKSYRALRGSLHAVQSLYQPYSSWIPKCEARIVALMPSTISPQRQGRATPTEHQDRFRHMFERSIGPHSGWAMLVEVGFLIWIGSTIGLIWCVESQANNWRWRYGWQWCSSILVGLSAWIVGMLNA